MSEEPHTDNETTGARPRTRNWRKVRADAERISGSTPARRAAARRATEDYVRTWALRQVRENRQVTQTELAAALGIGQPRVSRLENGDLDTAEVQTLRAYVEALGGRLRITADFDDQQVVLA